jgi:hypothetical protein
VEHRFKKSRVSAESSAGFRETDISENILDEEADNEHLRPMLVATPIYSRVGLQDRT